MVRAKKRWYLCQRDGEVLQSEFKGFARRLYELSGDLYGAAAADLVFPGSLGPALAEITGLAGLLQAMVNEYQRRLRANVELEIREKLARGEDPAL